METSIHGFAEPAFAGVRAEFERNFAERGDARRSRSPLATAWAVDLWGGWLDEAGERPWERDSIVNVWSVGKAVAAVCLRAAEPVLKDGPPGDGQLSLWSGLGLVAVWQVDTANGLEFSGRAMSIALVLGEEDRWVTNAVMHSYHLNAMGRLAEGLELLGRAWDVANRLNNTYRAFVAALWLGGHLEEIGDPLEGRTWGLREVDQPRQRQAPTRRYSLQALIAGSLAAAGEMDGCRALMVEGGIRAGPDIAFWEGDWDSSEAAWTKVRETAPARLNRSNLALADYWLARIARVRGDGASAAGFLLEALTIGLDGPSLIIQMQASPELAIGCAEKGLLADSEVHLERCRAILARGEDWRGLGGRVALAEAMVAGASGSLDEAEAHFARALAVFQRYSLRWDEAEALQLRARMYARAGRHNRATAVESFEAAMAIYRGCAAAQPWIEHAIGTKRTSIGSQPASPPRRDGLTGREVEVLRLISIGRSSKEIGDELVLSVRTVEHHIANIYLKTSTHGRVEAAAYAHAHGFASPSR